MALELMVDSLEGIDESLHGLYVEADGKFKLDVDGIEDTSGLKSALQKEREARREYEKKYGAVKDVDVEEYQRLKTEASEREQKKMEEAGEFEKIREKWAKEHDKLKESYEAKLAEKAKLLDKLVLEDRVRNTALKAGVIPDDIEDVLLLTARYFKLDESGNIRVLDSNKTETTDSIEDFFGKTFKEAKPKFYAGLNATGGGTNPGGTKGGKPGVKEIKREDFDALSQRDRAKAVKDGVKVV